METALACEAVSCRREFWNDAGSSRVENATTAFRLGEFCGLTGPDGCGKGLLLNLLGLLETADSGTIRIGAADAAAFPAAELQQIRNETFGFLFSHPCLLPSFSVAENVAMPLFRICGGDARQARARTLEVLDFCGISHLEATLAGRLDPAARRLTALARALVHSPEILIAISPGGGADLLALARRAAGELGLCVLWAGDAQDLRLFAQRLIVMDAGRITNDIRL